MSLIYPSLTTLDAATLAANLETLTEILLEYNASLDLRRGVIKDLVLTPRALLATATEQAVETALTATSLSQIVANPAIADPTSVDWVLGNFLLTRQPASASSGQIAIVISRLVTTIIPAGSQFTINGQVFTANNTYIGRVLSDQVLLPTDYLLTPVSGGNYLMVIGATASVAAAAGNVSQGASAIPASAPFAFVRAYAYVTFTGGADAESNTSLLNRFTSGPAARAWSTRPSIEATLQEQTAFRGIVATSVIGHGDPEMIRDQHSLWPVAGGGRADLYARTAAMYITETLTKTATLISVTGPVGTWQFGMATTDSPGYYEIVSITLPSGNPSDPSFPIVSDTRSADLTGTSPPDVVGGLEAAYSAYQTSVVRFQDTTTNASSLTVNVATAQYSVTVRRMASIADIQAFWNDPKNGPTGGDVLVKGPVPCFTSISATLNVPAGTVVATSTVAAGLAAAINDLGFTGLLAASFVSKTLHALVPAMASITDYNFSARIHRPDGTDVYLAGAGDLTVPDSPGNLVTANTVGIFVDPSNVTLTVSS